MAYSYNEYTGDGETLAYPLSFVGQDEGYISVQDIEVTVDDVEVPFEFLSANTIELSEPPPQGSSLLIRRVMEKDRPITDFKRGNNFGQEALNDSFLQVLYIMHELIDGWFPDAFSFQDKVTFLRGLRSLSPDPEDPSSVVTFENLDKERDERVASDQSIQQKYQAADANIQSQLTGKAPLMASAFSEISWHGQVINNSVTVPPGKNAWSFGPALTIAEGQEVTLSEGSYWTLANGEGETFSINYDGGVL